MAPTTDRDPEDYRRAVQYLVGALRKNPLEEGAEIVANRNRLLGIEDNSSQAGAIAMQAERKLRREGIINAIDELRSNFWAAPLAELQATLTKLDASDFPDLHAAVGRLSRIAAHRGRFPTLTSFRQFDPDFFLVFKDVLVSSPKDAAIAKERMLASFATGKKRRRGQKMIKLLAEQMPEVYSLEGAWLDTLARQKTGSSRKYSRVPQSQRSMSAALEGSAKIPWWLIVLGIALLRLLIAAGKH